MSDPREEAMVEAAAPPGEPATAPPHSGTAARWRGVALGLAVALLLVVALVGTAPYWAGALPWAPQDEPAFGPRLDRLDAEQQRIRQQRQEDAAKQSETLQRLDRRLAALEGRPVDAAGDATELRRRLSEAVDDLKKRLEAYEYKHERLVADVGDLAQTLTDLGRRLDTLDKGLHAQAANSTNTAIVLVLLQIREAVAVARPFTAEYETLLALARSDPEIAAAAAPLAEPAKSGVAGRAALADRLRGLRAAIAMAEAPPPESAPPAPGWTEQALDRLSRLVQIRRVDETGHATPSGAAPVAVDVAAQSLAGGDLDAAVAALDKLTGAPALAAAPWLRMAKQRLAVEQQLRRLEALLAARLGAAGDAVAAPGSSR